MSSHFTFSELTRTDTGLTNIPNDYQTLKNLLKLWSVLDVIRNELGLPIHVNSSYRSDEVNQKVGGVKNSNHLKGLAADIKCKDMHRLKVILDHYKLDGVLNELIVYKTFYHISVYQD